MSIDLSRFHDPFFEESDEAVDTIESACLAINLDNIDPEAINTIFRATHTIKGGSATFGFSQVAEFAHGMENKLDELRSGKQTLDLQGIEVLLGAVDGLKALLAVAKQGKTLASAEFASYQRLLGPVQSSSTAADSGSTFTEPSPPEQSPADNVAVQKDAVVIGQLQKYASVSNSKTIRVDFEKIDFLMDMIGEMVITQSTLSELCENESSEGNSSEGNRSLDRFQQGLHQLQQQTRLLQEGVMKIRMLPMAFCFDRFPRMVRDISGQLGKKIELVITGKNTELDKIIIEKLTDPLLHLLRNSIDHGIETPEVRLERGKNEVGYIRINAFHRAGYVVIELEDDGKGLDPSFIVNQAKDKQLIPSETILTDDAKALELIFLPGFSTLNKASNLSGRGVGMDVVKRNIEALGGVIKVHSDTGRRTAFEIKLPLTLAIIEGQLLAVEDESFVVPAVNIVESILPDEAAIGSGPDLGEVIYYCGQQLPVLRLAEALEIPRPMPRKKLSEGVVVIIDNDGQQFGLFVDVLLTQQPIVIKSLNENYQSIAGMSGATVLGNGKVALILDVNELGQMLVEGETDYACAG